MSKYDKEREAMGLKPVASSASVKAPSKSKYDEERNTLKEFEQRQVYQQQRVESQKAAPPIQRVESQPEVGKEWQQDKSRQLPVIGPILRGLDAVANNSVIEKVGEIGRSLYMPGAGLANVAGLTSAAEAAVGKAASKYLPQVGHTLAGRIAQKGASEAIVGAPLGAGFSQMTNPDASTEEFLETTALGAATGGALGAAGKAVVGAATRFGQQAAEGLAQNAMQNASKNVRSVASPFNENAAVSNPIANSYTKRVGDTFENRGSAAKANSIDPTPPPSIGQRSKYAAERETIMQDQTTTASPSQSAEVPSASQTDVPQLEIPSFLRNRGRRSDEAPPAGSRQTDEVLASSPAREIAEEAEDLIQTQEPRLRDKIYNSLDEAEKAARERLRAKRNTLSSNPVDQWADHAIILASQIGKGGIKLADATEYLVKEFGEEIRPQAKAILAKARSIVQETERRASKQAQDAKAFNEIAEGDSSSFRNKVSRDVKKERTPFAQRWEEIRSQFVDDLAALEGVETRVRGEISSAESSLYKSARMFRGVPEKANQIVKDRLAPIITGLEKTGRTSTDLGDYALAIHARDVNARDIKSGFTNQEIKKTIDALKSPEMDAAHKSLIQINKDMLQELVDTGVISKELFDALEERYPNYVPLFRAMDDDKIEFARGMSDALANVTAPIKGLKGSNKKVIDPLENMVKNIFQSTQAAERNKVSQQIAKLADDELESKVIRKLGESDEIGSMNVVTRIEDGKRVRYEVEPLIIRKLNPGEEVGRKNVVHVLEEGKKVQYEVEPEVYKAILNLDKESRNTLIKILHKPASLLRAGATLTPEFSLRNPMRDVVQAFITSKSGFNPLLDFPIGVLESIMGARGENPLVKNTLGKIPKVKDMGSLYKRWVDELGAFGNIGNIISNDRNTHREALERVLKESPGKKFVNVINGKSLIRVLRAITDTTESATKVGEFRAALRQGQTPQEAAYRSRDLMDFGRTGSGVRQTNKIVAFLNANIQGKSKLIRAFQENPAGFTARAFTSITLPTVGIFLAQKYLANDEQKKTIDESPAWMKDTFWLIPIAGTDQVARIPKPFDLATLFSNLPERALNFAFDNEKEAFDGFARKAIADAALPGMITGLTPIIEGMANYSFFRGGRIIPQGEDTRKYEDQYDINTTETGKALAWAARKLTGGKGAFKNFSSPRVADNTIRGLTAGLGGYATSAIDAMLAGLNVTDNPVRPAKPIAQQPLARAFLVNPNQSGRSTEKLYNEKDKLTREKGSAKLNDEPFKESGKLNFIEGQTDRMSEITKQIRTIEKSRTLNAREKQARIENLLKQRNEIAQKAAERLNR